jgi:hypothetical protein
VQRRRYFPQQLREVAVLVDRPCGSKRSKLANESQTVMIQNASQGFDVMTCSIASMHFTNL